MDELAVTPQIIVAFFFRGRPFAFLGTGVEVCEDAGCGLAAAFFTELTRGER